MKKILLTLIIALFGLQADGFDIKGIINNVDHNTKVIMVNNIAVQVMPQTYIKLDDCGIFGMDMNGKFIDLEVGSFVEVEAYPNSVIPNMPQNAQVSYIASEIEKKCVGNRAY